MFVSGVWLVPRRSDCHRRLRACLSQKLISPPQSETADFEKRLSVPCLPCYGKGLEGCIVNVPLAIIVV